MLDSDDEKSNDLVAQSNAMPDGFSGEQPARFVVLASSLTSRAQSIAQKLDVLPAFDTATKALVNVSTDRASATNQLPCQFAAPHVLQQLVRVFPRQVVEEQRLRISLELPDRIVLQTIRYLGQLLLIRHLPLPLS